MLRRLAEPPQRAALTRRGALARVAGAKSGRLGHGVVPGQLKMRSGSLRTAVGRPEAAGSEDGSLRTAVGSPEAAKRRADLSGHGRRSAGAPRSLLR